MNQSNNKTYKKQQSAPTVWSDPKYIWSANLNLEVLISETHSKAHLIVDV